MPKATTVVDTQVSTSTSYSDYVNPQMGGAARPAGYECAVCAVRRRGTVYGGWGTDTGFFVGILRAQHGAQSPAYCSGAAEGIGSVRAGDAAESCAGTGRGAGEEALRACGRWAAQSVFLQQRQRRSGGGDQICAHVHAQGWFAVREERVSWIDCGRVVVDERRILAVGIWAAAS
jgi:hypothetical protein